MTRRAQSVVDPEVSRLVKEWRGGPKYNRVGNVGKGAFASVYLVATKFEGTLFAAKEVEKRRFMKNGILDQKVDMEMKIMRKIQHVSCDAFPFLMPVLIFDLASYSSVHRGH